MTSKRNDYAVIATQGACNPHPLIRGLHEGLEELKAERPDADHPTIFADPALRLIVYQLAYLFRANDYNLAGLEYNRLCVAVGMPGYAPFAEAAN